jgi:hypothetical protein
MALLGKTVKCGQCTHPFTITEPPESNVPAEPVAVAAGSKPLMPPPLPVRGTSTQSIWAEATDAPSERDDRRRRRVRDHVRPTSAGALAGLVAIFLFGFVLLVTGLVYLLWPKPAQPTTPVTQGPSPAVQAPVAQEPQKNLADILNDAPKNGAAQPGGARPGVPRFDPAGIPDPGVPVMPNVGPRRPLVAPVFPQLGPAPAAVEGGPKFAPIVARPLKPARLAGDQNEIALPGPVESAVVAGGGRLLLLHVPRVNKVVVFDVCEARIVKEIDAPANDTMLAGGMNLFVIYQPKKNVIERWSCDKLERVEEIASPFKDPVKALAMGSASNGPLVAALIGSRKTGHRGATLAYFNPSTMKEVEYVFRGTKNPFGIGTSETESAIRVNTNGTVVTGWSPKFPAGSECHVLTGNENQAFWVQGSPPNVLPSPDGRYLATRGQILGTDLNGPPGVFRRDFSTFIVPAVQGNWYIVAQEQGPRFAPGAASASLGMFAVGKDDPTKTFEMIEDVDLSRIDQGLDQSLFLIPDAQVLITIAAPKRNKLILRRVELK